MDGARIERSDVGQLVLEAPLDAAVSCVGCEPLHGSAGFGKKKRGFLRLFEYHDYFQIAFHYMVLRHTTHGCRYFGTRPESRVLGSHLL